MKKSTDGLFQRHARVLFALCVLVIATAPAWGARTDSKYGPPTPKPDTDQTELKTAQDFYLAAIQAFRAGRSPNAERYARTAVSLKADFADAHYLLGKIYLFRAAAKNRLAIQSIGAGSPEMIYVRRYEKGREELQRSRSEFEVVVKLQPKAADAWLNLGICEDNLGREKAGIIAYRKAVELGPLTTTARDAYNNLGLVLQAEGDLRDALEAFENALRIDPTFSPSRINRDRLFTKNPKLKKEINTP